MPSAVATPGAPPLAGCSRASGAECDAGDDSACSGWCRADCTCAIVVELPLGGWTALDDTATSRLVEDDVTGARVLAVAAPGSALDETRDGVARGLAYPATPALGLALPQLAFSVRASAAFDLEVVVRGVDEGRYVLAYRAADPAAGAAPVTVVDNRAVVAIGAAMAAGEVGTTYRDLAADLGAAFGAAFARVDQVRVHGTLELWRVTLASDRAPGDETAAMLTLPLAGWNRRGRGHVVENAADEALPGLTIRADSTRPRPLLRLTYPPGAAAHVLPFGTLVFAVRDAAAFSVTVRGITTVGHNVALDYALDGVMAPGQRRRAPLPLALIPRAASPYADVRIDVAADVAARAAAASLAAITSVTLQGSFAVGSVQLRDPITARTARNRRYRRSY